jgi:hypothetical protein
MSEKVSKNAEIVNGLYKNRDRKGELAEGLFVCPSMVCEVTQKCVLLTTSTGLVVIAFVA